MQATLLGGGTRSQDTLIALSVAGITATATDDYTASWNPAVLTIPAGDFDATATLTLTLVDDTIHEDPEQLAVRGDNADPGLPVNGVRLIITDNDPAPTAVNLSLSDNALPESGNHLPDIYATLVGDSTLTSDIEISITIGNSALRAQPYGGGLLAPLTIAAGESTGESFMSLRDTDDDVEDADETIEIHGTTNQPGLIVNPARVTIVNDDTSGISLSKDSLTVREGRRSSYAVWLDSEPTGTVMVTVDVPANAGFTVNPGTLTFTPQSWGTQQVLVRGTLDLDGDDEPPAVITHSISSSDLKYNSASAGSVTVTVRDTSAAMVTVTPTELTIAEGGSGTYTVSLDTEPTGDVTITIAGAGTALSLDSDTLTFTTTTWPTAQTVTVTANEDDNAVQDSHTLTHTVSGGGYDGITGDDVVAIVTDNDTAGVTIKPTEITVVAGRSNEYTVVLDTEPTGDMVVSAQGYAGTGLGADDPVLVFKDTNWSTAMTVTMTALEDAARATVRINHIAAGGGYDGVSVDDVTVTLLEAPDRALVQVGVMTSDQALTVGEGQSETYTMVLGHKPAGDVTVTLGGVSNTDVTLSDGTLTFTSTNWNAPQTVTVTAAHDGDAADDTVTITHTVASATDTAYDGLSAENVVVTVADDDTAGVTISETSLTIEEGNTGTYTVVLDSQPAGNVTVAIGGTGTDVSLDKTTLTFTGQNWGTAQTVTVTAVDDAIDEDSETVTLTHTVTSVADTDYNGISAGSVTVSINDNDTAGVTVSETALTIEEGNTDTYTVVLNSLPAGNVTVTISGHASTDVSLDKTTLTFTDQNWSTAQTVTVTAEEDGDSQDEADVTLSHAVASSADTGYNGITAGSVTVSINDNDTDGVTISDTALTIQEGNTGTYTIVLDTEPTGNVTVTITNPTDNTDVTADPATLTFTDQNWGTAQTVTVTAAQDDNADDETATVTHAVSGYGTVNTADDVTVTVADDAPGSLTVKFGAAAYSVKEEDDADTPDVTENEAEVTVTLDVDPKRTVNIPVNWSGQGGATAADFSGVPTSVAFSRGETEKTLTFTAATDDVVDDGESVKLTFGTLPTGVTAGTPAEAVVSIDDTTRKTRLQRINFDGTESDSTTVAGEFKMRVHFLPSATGLLEEELEITNGTIVAYDFEARPAGQTTVNVWYINILPDDEAPTVTVRVPPDVVDGGNQPAEVTYDTSAPLTVQLTTNADEPVINSFRVIVTFSAPVSEQEDSAESGDSWIFSPDDDLEISHGAYVSSQQISSQVWHIAVNPANAVGTTVVTLGQGWVATGADTDVWNSAASLEVEAGKRSVTFQQAAYTAQEGEDVTVTVTLDADPLNTVVVPLTHAGQDGADADDYSGIPPSLTFNSGEMEKTFTFSATQDSQDDDGESVKIGIGTPLPNIIKKGTTFEATVGITDDDTAAVTINPTTLTVTEGGTNTYTIVLASQPAGDVIVTVNDPTDNTDVTTHPASLTFTTTDWNTARTVTVTASQDGDAADETATITHTVASASDTNYQAISTDDVAVTLEDDAPDTVTVNFKEAAYDADEGASVDVTVTLDNDPERTITVPLTHMGQGGATSADYSRVPGNVTFDSGDTEKTFSFAITADDVDDDAESVKLGFVNLPTGVSEGSINETVVSIIDDDVPSVTVSFKQATYTATEGGTVDVKVKLDVDPERTVAIPITKTNQDGATSADYSGVPENVVFNSGDTEKTITFQATADSVDDDDESVRLTFGTLPDRVTAGTTSDTVVSITDDDAPAVTVNFQQATYTVNEGSAINITVTISPDPERTVRIPLSVTNQGGATSADHSLVLEAITFNAGNLSRVFTFQADQDTDNDDGESVKLTFGTMPTGVSEGTVNETVVSITDDVPSVTVSYEQATYTVAEGSSVTVKVKLNVDPERTVTIPVTKANQGGATSADYSGVPGNVTFNSGDTEKTFSFAAASDSDNDDGESVKLTFGTMPTGVSEGTVNETVVSITDDDVPSVTVSYEQATYTVAEGSSVTVKVKLNVDPERTVTIPVTKANQGGATSADYSGVPGNVTFNSGDTEKTFSFAAASDSDNDDGESVKLTFGTMPTGVSEGTVNETVVSITDDDVPSVTVSYEQATYNRCRGKFSDGESEAER